MKPRILFLDSGIGGLSIYQEVEKLCPNCQYFYCLDNECFPYSEKSEQLINERILKICQIIHQQSPLDLIVIACNTASTAVLPQIQQFFSIPIIGTTPAIQQASQISKTKHIALLATKGTVTRPCVLTLIQQLSQTCQFEKIGSTLLVEMAEKKLQGEKVNLAQLRQHLAQLIPMTTLDTLILGCTHFPFLENEFRQILPQINYYIHAGERIAKDVSTLFPESNIASKKTPHHLFATAPLTLAKQQIFTDRGFLTAQQLIIKNTEKT